MKRRELARRALEEALRVRRDMKVDSASPVCPFDLAEGLGIEVRFLDIPSLEGMYVQGTPPLICLPSERPPGRQGFSCAHEVGHHRFGHGTRADHLELRGSSTPKEKEEEFLANMFAGYLLMSKKAVTEGFRSRGWGFQESTPEQVYTVASWLGVSYQALGVHMRASLSLISEEHQGRLRQEKVKTIKSSILGKSTEQHLTIVDSGWLGRAVDLSVGDLMSVPPGCSFPTVQLALVKSSGACTVLEAVSPGVGRLTLESPSWAAFVRVSRRAYTGRSIYRHLEEPEES